MKFLVNDKEYAEVLAELLLRTKLKKTFNKISVPQPTWKKISKIKNELSRSMTSTVVPGLKLAPKDHRDYQLLNEFIIATVTNELTKWVKTNSIDEKLLKKLQSMINKKFSNFTVANRKKIHELFLKSTRVTITKQISQAWSDNRAYEPRQLLDIGTHQSLFIRNIVHNEEVIKKRINDHLPFWFMDTGYTNFLESSKKWHRICKNNIHYSLLSSPTNDKNRLSNFPILPAPWRQTGRDIIVIEPSATVCYLYNINITEWRTKISRQLTAALTSDKNIIFREKANKKVRGNFYHELLNDDVYCVVHYNSNAAVEAVWAGVPVITLGDHITRSISVNNVNSVNNLKYPDLKNWLKLVSYSQYTIDEIANGTARQILENKIYA